MTSEARSQKNTEVSAYTFLDHSHLGSHLSCHEDLKEPVERSNWGRTEASVQQPTLTGHPWEDRSLKDKDDIYFSQVVQTQYKSQSRLFYFGAPLSTKFFLLTLLTSWVFGLCLGSHSFYYDSLNIIEYLPCASQWAGRELLGVQRWVKQKWSKSRGTYDLEEKVENNHNYDITQNTYLQTAINIVPG